MKGIKIDIPNPCQEDWNKMKIGLDQRFCDSCQKNVIDFTQKSRSEILSYLLINSGQKTCGRINKSQLDFYHEDIYVTIKSLTNIQKKSNLPFYILSIGSLILAGCNPTENPKTEVKTEIVQKDCNLNYNDTIKIKHLVGGISLPEIATLDPDSIEDNILNHSKFIRKPIDMTGEVLVVDPDTIQEIEEIIMGDFIATDPNPELKVYDFVQQMPEFPNGMDSLITFMKANLVYPEYEKKNHIEGRIFATFIVEKDGKITNAKITSNRTKSENFEIETIKVINKMPNWIPGKQNGNNVAVRFTLPVKFEL